MGLVACCDIAIGVPDAKFGLTEAKLGLLPAVISPYVIAAIGTREARRWFATGEIFDAATAGNMLVHGAATTAKVINSGDTLPESEPKAKRINLHLDQFSNIVKVTCG